MTFGSLETLWTVSIIMGGASTLVMLLMIAWRATLSLGSATANELRDATLQSLITDWTLLEDDLVRRVLGRPRLLADLVTELATLVRGPEFTRITDYLSKKGAPTLLLRQLRQGNREGKLAACEALSHFPSANIVTQLSHTAAFANSGRLRIAALRALIQMGYQPPLDNVIRWMALKRSDIPAEASTVLKMVVHQNPGEALDRIIRAVDTPGVRAALIWAIGEKGGYEAIPVLQNLTIENDARIRAAALHALGQIGVCSDPLKLKYCLADGVTEVRAEAAAAIGKTGDTSAIRLLSVLLDDENWIVRFRSACALADLDEPGISELRLTAHSAAPASRRARAAAMVLSERGLS